VKKGEFVCVIGDVAAGKSSLLQAINGAMIYVPNELVKEFNGKRVNSQERQFITEESLTYQIVDPPIRVSGSVCYVEQQPWL
jgi:energy-coupling factor transporter ATP-binding protein EcfA2